MLDMLILCWIGLGGILIFGGTLATFANIPDDKPDDEPTTR